MSQYEEFMSGTEQIMALLINTARTELRRVLSYQAAVEVHNNDQSNTNNDPDTQHRLVSLNKRGI